MVVAYFAKCRNIARSINTILFQYINRRAGVLVMPNKLESIIEEEQKRMLMEGKRYVIEPRYFHIVSAILSPGEYVVMGATQRFPHALAPSLLIATNKRVLLIKLSFWTLYTGHNIWSPSNIVNIHYDRIAQISLSSGRFFSTIKMKIVGSETNVELPKLTKKEGRRMVGFLERISLADE